MAFWRWFSFSPRWDMLIPWRVFIRFWTIQVTRFGNQGLHRCAPFPVQRSSSRLSERHPKSKEFCCFFSKIFISISKIGSNHWDAYIYICRCIYYIYIYICICKSILTILWLDTEKRSVGLLSNWTHNPGRSRKERPMLGRSRFFGLFGALIWCKKTRARPRPVIFLRIYSVPMVGMCIWNPMHMIYIFIMICMMMINNEWSYAFVMCTCITREVDRPYWFSRTEISYPFFLHLQEERIYFQESRNQDPISMRI